MFSALFRLNFFTRDGVYMLMRRKKSLFCDSAVMCLGRVTN